MYVEERRKFILELLEQEGRVSIKKLAHKFDVSEGTIRNDLNYLEKSYLIKRTHGGAISSNFTITSLWDEQVLVHRDEKERIAKAAASLIKPGDKIMLDSGTTVNQLSKNLGNIDDLICIARDLRVAINANIWSNTTVLLTGGILIGNLPLTGSDAIRNILFHNDCDKFFMSTDSISLEKGIRIQYPDGVETKRAMMKASSETILLADSSKFGKAIGTWVCDVKEIKTIISDKQLPQNIVTEFYEIGIQVILV